MALEQIVMPLSNWRSLLSILEFLASLASPTGRQFHIVMGLLRSSLTVGPVAPDGPDGPVAPYRYKGQLNSHGISLDQCLQRALSVQLHPGYLANLQSVN